MGRLPLLLMLAAPLFAQKAEFDLAVRKAGNRAGLWKAVLNERESQIFSPEDIRAVFLDIDLGVSDHSEQERLGTTILLQRNDGSVDGILLLVDHPVLEGDHISLDARWYSLGPQDHLKMEADFASSQTSITGTIGWHGRSIQVEFTRPASNGSAYDGEWINSDRLDPGVFHVRNLGDGRFVAVFDQLRSQPTFGGLFLGEIQNGKLHLWPNRPGMRPSAFDGTLDSTGKLMKGEWLFWGSGDFHRIETTWYVPEKLN